MFLERKQAILIIACLICCKISFSQSKIFYKARFDSVIFHQEYQSLFSNKYVFYTNGAFFHEFAGDDFSYVIGKGKYKDKGGKRILFFEAVDSIKYKVNKHERYKFEPIQKRVLKWNKDYFLCKDYHGTSNSKWIKFIRLKNASDTSLSSNKIMLDSAANETAFLNNKKCDEKKLLRSWYCFNDSCLVPETIQQLKFTTKYPKNNYYAWHFTDTNLVFSSIGVNDGVYIKSGKDWKLSGCILKLGDLKFEVLELTDSTLNIKKQKDDNENKRIIIAHPETEPEYLNGGYEGLNKFIASNLKVPNGERVDGRVYVGFTVDTLGQTKDFEIKRGLTKEANEEAIRIAKLLLFKPAKLNGKTIESKMVLPISFIMSK